VPRAPLPGLGVTQIRAMFNIASVDITPPSSLIRAHASVLRPLSSFSFIKTVFAGCCQPLLAIGPSRHYLCNPCVGAWTHTSLCSFVACTHFFTKDAGLTSRETRSAHRKPPTPCVRIVVASEGPFRPGFLAVSAASSPVGSESRCR
jgi:hypothetical protein